MKKQLLLLAMILLPLIANAHDIEVKNADDVTIYYKWNADKTELSVTYRGNDPQPYLEYSDNVVIPESVNYEGKDYPVTSIGDWSFCSCPDLTSVTIPNSVTDIDDYAFTSCSSLTSITIPNSVTSIGREVFSYCRGLTSVNIPNSVTNIGAGVFIGCSGLTSVSIPNCITSIGISFFAGCSSLTSFFIPDCVTSIGNYAFSGCSSLTSITIPNSVTSFGIRAFSGCSSLTSFTIPNSVVSIGDGAFIECSGLKYITIPNSVTSIEQNAFSGCSGLTSVIIPNSVKSIGNGAFLSCSGLTSVIIPNSVKSIGNNAFQICTKLTSVSIGNNVTSIGECTFQDCRLENVLTLNSKTTFVSGTWAPFSNRTLQHAMLYVQEGTWREAVYDGSWYLFNNIREVAMNQENLSPAKAYALMDTKSFGYAVFDGSSDEVKMTKAFYSMDENDLNNCWQVIDKSGAKYLYNIGAKKYAKIASNGKITLTDNETPVNITEGENGLKFGLDTSREWGFVKNNNVTIDNQTGINPVSRTSSESSSTYFSLDGQQTTQPKMGLNIVRKSDGTTKKIVVK